VWDGNAGAPLNVAPLDRARAVEHGRLAATVRTAGIAFYKGTFAGFARPQLVSAKPRVRERSV
jgi:hypothetical protein